MNTRIKEATSQLRLTQSLKKMILTFAVPIALLSHSALAYKYECKSTEPNCVTNFNHNLAITPEGRPKSIKIFRVVTKAKSADMREIENNTQHLIRFFRSTSHGQFDAEVISKETIEVEGGSCQTIQNQALRKAKDSAYFNIFALPGSECNGSHAGSGNIWLDGGGLFRTYAHESGHIMGLGHGNKNFGHFDDYADPSTYMGETAAISYNAPQLFWLGWTKKTDVVRINDDLDQLGEIVVKLRAVNVNAKNDDPNAAPLAYVYDQGPVSSLDAPRLFIAMPRSSQGGYGREIFVYRANCTKGCGTTWSGKITMKDKEGVEVDGLMITPVEFNENFTEVTIKIKKAN
jgi:hypothetical protein